MSRLKVAILLSLFVALSIIGNLLGAYLAILTTK